MNVNSKILLAAASLLLTASQIHAQSYPQRPVRLIVPFGAGGPDAIARIVGQKLGAQMGQNIVVDNRPGANGIVGTETVARAAPDGHTLLLVSASIAVNPSIYRSLPYDAVNDFTPITTLCALDAFILTVHAAVPAKTVQEFVALGRRADSKLAYGSPGIGNTIHLTGALFAVRAKTSMTHVPYKGGGPAVAALLGGDIQAMFASTNIVLPHIKSGRLRALGVTGKTRLAQLPDAPTFTEAGVPGMEIEPGWFGLFGPVKLPAAITNKLYEETRIALANPQVRDKLTEQGFPPKGNTPAQFKAYLASEIKAYAEMTRVAGIKPE